MPRSSRPAAGDVFEIGLGISTVAVGQVIDTAGAQLLVVAAQGEHNPGEMLAVVEPALLGITLDAFFFHKRWTITATGVEPVAVEPPAFCVLTPGGWVRESFHREEFEVISPEVAVTLRPRKVVAPVRFDKATKALHGYLPWDPIYDDLLVRS